MAYNHAENVKNGKIRLEPLTSKLLLNIKKVVSLVGMSRKYCIFAAESFMDKK